MLHNNHIKKENILFVFCFVVRLDSYVISAVESAESGCLGSSSLSSLLPVLSPATASSSSGSPLQAAVSELKQMTKQMGELETTEQVIFFVLKV